jgi:hypothetical protein
MAWFRETHRIPRLMLDVGGTHDFWKGSESAVDILNSEALPQSPFSRKAIVGDGCALPFPNKSYPLVFSNSVIEHVGNYERQKAFAKEARRVGLALWIQTPAFEFPFEPHFLAPFIHYAPVMIQPFLARWLTPRGWLDRSGTEQLLTSGVRLLSYREMRSLFPDCEIFVERFLGVFPKSYVAVRR